MIALLHRRYCRRALLFALAVFVAPVAMTARAEYPALSEEGRGTVPAPGRSFADTILRAHNGERKLWHVEPLMWDNGLAADAAAHARLLAHIGYLRHADRKDALHPQGENLWMGTRNGFSYDQMMDGFLEERRYYVPHALPDISTTGNWSDTGHYSQIIWRTTTAVGCAVASSADFDFLVCRYSPSGNVWGRRADDRDADMKNRAWGSLSMKKRRGAVNEGG